MECGDSVTQLVPVKDGNVVNDGVLRRDFGGNDLTKEMAKLLIQKGYTFPNDSAAEEFACMIKEKFGYVALDFGHEPEKMTSYESPDGDIVTIGKERFLCPELLFQQPFTNREDLKGIHRAIAESISLCITKDLRDELYANIVLSGGSTMFPGFIDRVKQEVKALAPPGTKVNVVAAPERKYSVWVGGSLLSTLVSFQPV